MFFFNKVGRVGFFSAVAVSAQLVSVGVALADAPPVPVPVPVEDPCIDAMDLSPVNFSTFVSSSLQTRLMTLCELRDAVVSQYSQFDLKQERLKGPNGAAFDSLAYLNQCVVNEKAITNDDSDLHFIDRVSQCLAGFKDTHFWVSTPVSIPPVFTGLMVKQIGGKFYISQIMPDVLAYVNQAAGGSANLKAAAVVGNQILEVDGKNPADLVAEYSKYISGSSDDFVQDQATQSIFYRTFDYPASNSVEVKISDAAGNLYDLKLPWWGGIGAHTRADADSYFTKLGIPISDRVKIAMNAKLGLPDFRSVTMPFQGYDDTKPLFTGDAFNPILEFADDAGSPGLRVAEVVTEGQADFCYVELLTFETVNFTLGKSQPMAFADALRAVVSNCKAKGMDLVLDLRNNGGGNGSFPDVVLSILTEDGKAYGSSVNAFRVTQDTGRLLSSDNFVPEVAFEDLGVISMNPLDVYDAAVAAGQRETDIIPNQTLGEDAVVGGYPGKILTLVTPSCISACDMTAALLSKSGRSTLLGTHSNGTGGGFESSATLNSTFSDSNDELAIKIPNFLFGVPDKVLDPGKAVSYAQYENPYLTENRPTVAGIQYSLTTDDLDPNDPGKGWRAAVLKVMKGK